MVWRGLVLSLYVIKDLIIFGMRELGVIFSRMILVFLFSLRCGCFFLCLSVSRGLLIGFINHPDWKKRYKNLFDCFVTFCYRIVSLFSALSLSSSPGVLVLPVFFASLVLVLMLVIFHFGYSE